MSLTENDLTEPVIVIEQMIDAGVSFEHCESYIEARRDLTSDQRSALWLLAWVSTSQDQRRSVVQELLSA